MTKKRRLKKITSDWKRTHRKMWDSTTQSYKLVPVIVKKQGSKYKIRRLLLHKRGPRFKKTQPTSPMVTRVHDWA